MRVPAGTTTSDGAGGSAGRRNTAVSVAFAGAGGAGASVITGFGVACPSRR
jgi:hypothetical protein